MERGICPHCQVVVRFEHRGQPTITVDYWADDSQTPELERGLDLHWSHCPNCRRVSIELQEWSRHPGKQNKHLGRKLLHPRETQRPPPPLEVPEVLRTEYLEAASVEATSPRAAAALARRCLQLTLHQCGFKGKNLNAEIDLAAADARVGSQLADQLHLLRQVGNYAAHPMADGAGGIIEVEPGELEALFPTLLELFDRMFVKPARDKQIRDAINQKLVAAGKQPV